MNENKCGHCVNFHRLDRHTTICLPDSNGKKRFKVVLDYSVIRDCTRFFNYELALSKMEERDGQGNEPAIPR